MKTSSKTIRGTELFYAESGEGPVILYIHGNTASHIWWEEVMNVPGYRTIAPDMPNFGQSGRIDSHKPADYASYLFDLMDSLGVEQALVVGHSLGGAVAMDLAVKHPAFVNGLFLLDSCPIDGLKTPKIFHPIIKKYLEDRELFSKAMKAIMGTRGSDEALVRRFVDEGYKMNPESFVGHAVSLGNVDYRKEAKAYNGPMRFICGSEDPLIKEKHAKKSAKRFGGDYRMIDGIGHCLCIEDPARFIAELTEFAGA
jgi:pimeloyl-ACP methyl ester carboxylesterase